MLIIPAIDLRGGRCVRLLQGDPTREKAYSGDPAAVASAFAAAGASRLHVVDLDGALGAGSDNRALIARIAGTPGLHLQVGGGLRRLADVEAVLTAGATWAILGTAAVEDPALVREAAARFPGRILVGIDARGGRVAVRGWQAETSRDAAEVAAEAVALGAVGVIHTDIAADGMLRGANLAELERVAAATRVPVLASGGIGTVAHLESVAALAPRGVTGAILGRALYEGALELGAVIRRFQSGA
ncbi:MAG: 1-(5-phosphoribosyl)-5-[(5-phosphoribosylamino)methylideneamino] imidazole-4-carboxamide isomerase [candidate division NC10 bacterium]|nr:1-(5-phosphoribosyl)-5-[(5-phosphoribosylamino)methylideneamino] imidazole-4-carboxamide isomerase [candidate division NC10 bacterium]